MNYEIFLYEKVNRAGVITLNRPRYYNALSSQVGVDLRSALEAVANDAAIAAVIITGGDKFFRQVLIFEK